MSVANWISEGEKASLASSDGTAVNLGRLIPTFKSIRASSSTAPIGYDVGAGGTVTQATSKVTGVTIDKACGQITTAADAMTAGQAFNFVVTCVACTNDLPLVCITSGPATVGTYSIAVVAVGAGSFTLRLTNLSAGNLSEAVVISFALVNLILA